MKILVFSDTHTHINECIDIIENTPEVSAVIHAGDHADDAEDLNAIFTKTPFYYVSGNNDMLSRAPLQRVVTIGNKKIFIAHGHTFGVRQRRDRFLEQAKSFGADIAVFGHTHECCDEYTSGIYVLNPGSMGNYPKTYGIIDIVDDKIYTKILKYT